ncbi:MADS-box domain-containing protein [Sporobolomyces salmoneus]|uniref:MADS-box domain-containing protein n=1 Tax=Sporobolomyces salmoneus TaxID=183962 RepID=UPI00318133DF
MPPRASTSKSKSSKESSSSGIVSFRPSTQLESSLSSHNRPTSTTSSKGKGSVELKFQKMSGRGRTRREEMEAFAEAEGLSLEDVAEEEEDEEEDEIEDDGAGSGDLLVEEEETPGKKVKGKGKATTKSTTAKEKEKEKNLKKRNSGSVGRRKISMSFIEEKARRTVTFTKRKSGLMKKAFELSTLTGTDCLVLVVSESGLVYTFTTPNLKAVTESDRGKQVISMALKGELKLDEPALPIEEGEGEGEQERGGSMTPAGASREMSLPTTVERTGGGGIEDLYLDMNIDPSLGAQTSNSRQSPFQLPPPPPSTTTTTTSSSNESYPFPVELTLPFPPHSTTNSAPESYSHQLPIPPPSFQHQQQQLSTDQNQHNPFPFFSFDQTATTSQPLETGSSSWKTFDLPNLHAASSSSTPFDLTIPAVPPHNTSNDNNAAEERERRNEGEETDFDRAAKDHQIAFEQYQAQTNWNRIIPTPHPTTDTSLPTTVLSPQEEGNLELPSGGGGKRRNSAQEVPSPVQTQERRSSTISVMREGEENESRQGQGGNKRRKLGIQDFNAQAIEWQNRIIQRATNDTVTGSDRDRREAETEGETRRDSRSSELSSSASRRESTIGEKGKEKGSGESLEERRRFWKEKAKESISNAKKSRSLLASLHAQFLSLLASSTIPPNLPRPSRNGEGEEEGGRTVIENLPKPTPASITSELLKQFIQEKGLDQEDLKLVVSRFIQDQETRHLSLAGGGAGGGRSSRIGVMKQHLIEWFDFLEGHELVTEEEYMDLVAFGG